ncbi:MAG TPA: hypothetical protein ENG94_04795 [Actinobacteria bacterium]|nr:hypothetical protein [Actinomycetota bacterium]HDL48576.1 hypothetical protein [Actinomycetota bacterium]
MELRDQIEDRGADIEIVFDDPDDEKALHDPPDGPRQRRQEDIHVDPVDSLVVFQEWRRDVEIDQVIPVDGPVRDLRIDADPGADGRLGLFEDPVEETDGLLLRGLSEIDVPDEFGREQRLQQVHGDISTVQPERLMRRRHD